MQGPRLHSQLPESESLKEPSALHEKKKITKSWLPSFIFAEIGERNMCFWYILNKSEWLAIHVWCGDQLFLSFYIRNC